MESRQLVSSLNSFRTPLKDPCISKKSRNKNTTKLKNRFQSPSGSHISGKLANTVAHQNKDGYPLNKNKMKKTLSLWKENENIYRNLNRPADGASPLNRSLFERNTRRHYFADWESEETPMGVGGSIKNELNRDLNMGLDVSDHSKCLAPKIITIFNNNSSFHNNLVVDSNADVDYDVVQTDLFFDTDYVDYEQFQNDLNYCYDTNHNLIVENKCLYQSFSSLNSSFENLASPPISRTSSPLKHSLNYN